MGLFIWGSRHSGRTPFRSFDPRAFVVGGFGHDGEAARNYAEVFEYRPKAGTWMKMAARLPSPRSQLGLAARGSVLWVFGGLDYDSARGKEAAFRHPTEVLTWDSSADGASFGDSGHRLPPILEKLPVHAAHVRVFPFQKKLLFASVGAEAEGLLRMAIFTPPLPIATAGLTDG